MSDVNFCPYCHKPHKPLQTSKGLDNQCEMNLNSSGLCITEWIAKDDRYSGSMKKQFNYCPMCGEPFIRVDLNERELEFFEYLVDNGRLRHSVASALLCLVTSHDNPPAFETYLSLNVQRVEKIVFYAMKTVKAME